MNVFSYVIQYFQVSSDLCLNWKYPLQCTMLHIVFCLQLHRWIDCFVIYSFSTSGICPQQQKSERPNNHVKIHLALPRDIYIVLLLFIVHKAIFFENHSKAKLALLKRFFISKTHYDRISHRQNCFNYNFGILGQGGATRSCGRRDLLPFQQK